MPSGSRQQELDALVMRVKPYRESSAMVDIFTRQVGRARIVSQGMRRRSGQVLQPFWSGRLTISGRGAMKTLRNAEMAHAFRFEGDALAAGFYVLELIHRTLAEHQEEPRVFAAALEVLTRLEAGQLSVGLRSFERTLLDELGYGVDLAWDVENDRQVEAERRYRVVPDHGVVPASRSDDSALSGEVLRAIQAGDFTSRDARRAALMINRSALSQLLGHQELTSRALLFSESEKT